MTRLLMIDDDTRLSSMVRDYLSSVGSIAVETAADAASGLRRLDEGDTDLLILDLMLPDADGLELCRRIRARGGAAASLPILMLTARGDPADRVLGLELGADDYLPKPFEPRELLARVRALLRRGGLAIPGVELRFGRLSIDRSARSVRIDGEPRQLTSYQFDVLLRLAENAGRVLSREQLIDALRGTGGEALDRSVDVHVARIRAAIEDDPRQPKRIITVRGAGYVFAREQALDPDRFVPPADLLAQRIAAVLPPAAAPASEQQAALEGAVGGGGAALFTAERQAIARAGRWMPPPRARYDDSHWLTRFSRDDAGAEAKKPPERLQVFALKLDDGRWLVAGRSLHPRRPVVIAFWFVLLAVGAALGAYPVARRLTRRLERLQHGVEELGRGDLQARVQVEGRRASTPPRRGSDNWSIRSAPCSPMPRTNFVRRWRGSGWRSNCSTATASRSGRNCSSVSCGRTSPSSTN